MTLDDAATAVRLATEGVDLAAGVQVVEEGAQYAEQLRGQVMLAAQAEQARLHRQLSLETQVQLERTRRAARRTVDAEERPPVALPEALTLAERLARPQDPVAWRVEGWFPAGGRVVMAAQAKAGKTTAAANLVRSLVDGYPFLGRDAVTPVAGKVAVLDFEMTERQVDQWYRQLGIENADRVLLMPLRGRGATFDLRDEDLRRQWAELLREHQVDLVIWDCLRPVVDALGLDENREASALLTAFDALLAEASHPEALVVHHMGHSGERARGDSGILGWPDANWKLVLDDGDERGPRWLSAYGRDVDQSETQLSRDPVTLLLTAVGGTRASARRTAAFDAVLAVLTEATEPLAKGTVEAKAMEAGVSRKTAREALEGMVAINQVLVEISDKNAHLHRLNPDMLASSPVFAEPAANTPASSSPPPIEGRTGEQTSEAETDPASSTFTMSEEQRAIVKRIESQP